MFWPKEIWGKYAKALEDFKDASNKESALACLNHMITDALSHVDECLDYMSKLRDPSIFAFCAIPQVMAIGTLEACYNNHNVFTGVVKMRRGETAKIMWFLKNCLKWEAVRWISGLLPIWCVKNSNLFKILMFFS